MAIFSSPFGPTILTGEDAEELRKMMRERKPNKKAMESYARGEARAKMQELLLNQNNK
ncbi:hypothetical protein [Edaphovirga cremea]|uniref:hypothetical protein n=1 Tax=Edaphovirga cremea TaxID=2267246 RepID=UPI00130055FB|nr:hypothetical protein [Edaphovirga cremea]